MVGAVDDGDLDVNDRVATQDTTVHGFLDTGVDRGDVFLRNRATDDFVDKLVAFARLAGFNFEHAMTILATATGLADKLSVGLDSLADRFFVGDLRGTDIGFDLELPKETVNDDVEVQFAHAGDQGLASFLVGVGAEGRIFFSQLGQGSHHLLLAGFGLRFDRDIDDRFREFHRFEDDRSRVDAECITGGRVFETDSRSDIAGVDAVDFFAVVGVHLQDAADAFTLALASVHDIGTGFELTGIDAEEAELADEGVGHDLECQGREGR